MLRWKDSNDLATVQRIGLGLQPALEEMLNRFHNLKQKTLGLAPCPVKEP